MLPDSGTEAASIVAQDTSIISTFFLFFAGLGALFTSILMWSGLLPEDYLYSLISLAISTGIFAVILYKPLSNMQNKLDLKRPTSDLVGHSIVLSEPIEILTSARDTRGT